MGGVLAGFGVVGSLIAAGFVVARNGFLGEHAERVLAMVAFSLATPALMFYLLARSTLREVLSPSMLVVAIASVTCIGAFVGCAVIGRWGVGHAVIGGLSSGYANVSNLGLPVATYVLGSTTLIAPVMMFQLVVLAPISLAILDIATGDRQTVAQRIVRPLRNPIVIASLAGLAVAASGWHPPDALLEPFSLLGHAAVPIMLLAFGMSLYRGGLPLRGGSRGQIALAVTLKSVGAPAVAAIVGACVFHLGAEALASVMLCAALPTAQNVFVYASRYQVGTTLARDAVFSSTIVAIPVLLVTSVVAPYLAP